MQDAGHRKQAVQELLQSAQGGREADLITDAPPLGAPPCLGCAGLGVPAGAALTGRDAAPGVPMVGLLGLGCTRAEPSSDGSAADYPHRVRCLGFLGVPRHLGPRFPQRGFGLREPRDFAHVRRNPCRRILVGGSL